MNDRTNTEYYTLQELAKRKKVSPKTVRRAIEAGDLEAIQVGRQFRITPAADANYDKAHKYKAKAVKASA